MYKTSHVSNLFRVSRETVRKWAMEFAEYLSPTGAGGGGRQRHFTDNDLKVFSLVVKLKEDGMKFDDIHAALANNQRGDIPDNIQDLAAVSHNKSVNSMSLQVATLNKKVYDLELMLASESGKVSMLEKQLEDAQQKIDKLNREIGALQTKQ